MPKGKFCVVVPAYNEEKVIEASLRALKQIVPKRNIYVASDGSKDNTVRLVRRTGVNILALRKNRGKAKSLFRLINKFRLIKRYQYILFSDADSRLTKGFLNSIKPYIKKRPACIVATVTSDRHGLISAYRTYEYSLSHLVFKNAQNSIGTITVAPGCAAIYRNDVLEKLDFSKSTLTEDFDLTIQIHQKKLGKIIYVPKALVTTQDPSTLKDYWHQVLRWYTGFWQNVFIYKLYLPTKKLNLEIYILTLDVFIMIASIVLLAFYPILSLKVLLTAIISFIFIYSFFIGIQKKWWALIYVPLFFAFYVINIAAYFAGFIRAILGRNRLLSWQKVKRYQS